jgi:3-deoxy-manno-octulosonate cytidylyltransferase (CMP-KDO synthetase)
MRTAIVIPARLGATRLPNKPLAELGGVPLVICTARQARKCRVAGRIIIATDDATIARAAKAHGIEAMMTRADHPSGTDRVAEAVTGLEAEWVLNLQGDEPFIDPADLDALFTALAQSGADLATLRAPLADAADLANPNVVKVVCRDDGLALYFSRAPIPFERAQTGSVTQVFRHLGVYGYRRAALLRLARTPPHPLELRESLEQLRALAIGLSIAVVTARTVSRGIDTPEDLTWARKRVQEMGDAAFP